ncbi:ATP-binding protein [Synergistales bacterium]|nr:ATP-binding protein [Synergistales bacterium]
MNDKKNEFNTMPRASASSATVGEQTAVDEALDAVKLLEQYSEVTAQAPEDKDEDNSAMRVFRDKYGKLFISTVAVIMTVYHVYALVFKLSIPLTLYASHWSFGLFLVFLLYPASSKKSVKSRPSALDLIFATATVIIAAYILVDPNALMYRAYSNSSTQMDLIMGAVAIVLSVEAARRTIGLGLPIVAMVFVAYALWGNYLPSMIASRGYRPSRILAFIFSTEGLFSSPIKSSAEYVFLLIVFGAFLSISGTGDFFMKLAMSIAGKSRGGPAKIAVLSSCLFGSISGSAVANVVGTGVFTIPLMKRNGYSPVFAGAVEAVASTGGQIMPPVMGSAAFIMAELIGWNYSSIALSALLPALLYYFSLMVMVDLEAAKLGLKGVDAGNMKKPLRIFLEEWNLLFPLFVLIYFLAFQKSTVSRSALFAIIAAVLGCAVKKTTRMSFKDILKGLETGAIRSLSVIAAVACAGVAVGAIMLTGLGAKFTFIVAQVAGDNLLLMLIFSAMATTVLGMGLPTVAAYIISASLLASSILQLGVPIFPTHMFLLYYSILSQITPPVALAAYVAGNIAKANPHRVGFTAMRLGSIAFILPFFFVYGPALLLQGSPLEVVQAVITSVIGAVCFAAAQHGWFFGQRLFVLNRIFLLAGGLCLIIPGSVTDIAGLAIIAVAMALHPPVRARLFGRKFIV